MKKFVFLASVVACLARISSLGHAETVYALAAPASSPAPLQILTFDTASTGTINNIATIIGLNSGDTIVDIDTRPANGLLYGIANSGNLYTINPLTGVATFNVAPSSSVGTATSIDFNPTADRLRIISLNTAVNLGGVNPGQLNYRLTPTGSAAGAAGTVSIDGTLAYAASDVNAGKPDRPNIIGSAYTNNFAGATTTTLYGLDNVVGQLGTQGFLVMHTGGPQFNSLTTVAGLTLGGMAFDLPDTTGFDISGRTGTAFVSISNANGNGGTIGDFLFTLDLSSGVLTPVGTSGRIGAGESLYNIQGIALAAIPEPSSVALCVVGALALGAGVARRRQKAVAAA